MAILSLTAIVLSVLLGHDYWWKNRSSDDGDEPRTRVARDSGNLRNAVPRGLQFDHTSEVATVKWARQLSREFRKLRTARMRNEIALGDGLSVTESRLRQLSGTNVEWSLPYRGVQGGNVLLGAVQTQRFIVTKRSRTGGNEPSRYLVLPYLLLSRHEMPTGGTLKKGWNRWTVSKTLPLLVGTEITRADAGTLNAGRRVKIKAKVRRVSVGTEGHFVTIELDDISFLGPVDEYPLTDANNILNPILLDVSPERLKTLSPGQVKSQLESSMQKLPSFRIR